MPILDRSSEFVRGPCETVVKSNLVSCRKSALWSPQSDFLETERTSVTRIFMSRGAKLMRKNLMRCFHIVLALLAVMAVSENLRGQQPDFSRVQIKTTKISNNFYTLEGQGGTVGVLVGPDGIFMVDCQFAPLSDKLMAAIKQVSDKPVRFLVNTHVHGDHTGD